MGRTGRARQAIRELNRNIDFRKALTYAIDRQHLGDSLVKGPFTAIYPGGLFAGTAYYDKASTVYYPFSIDSAKAQLEKVGLKDTDGNGIVNFPADTPGVGGKDVEVTLLANADYQTDKNLAEGVVASMEQVGIRVILNLVTGTNMTATQNSGKWDWQVCRQRLGADLGGAEHRAAGADRPADQLASIAPAPTRPLTCCPTSSRWSISSTSSSRRRIPTNASS